MLSIGLSTLLIQQVGITSPDVLDDEVAVERVGKRLPNARVPKLRPVKVELEGRDAADVGRGKTSGHNTGIPRQALYIGKIDTVAVG